MKVSILGVGDVSKISRHSDVPASELKVLIDSLGKFLADNGYEIVIIPDRGVPLEVAKSYKKHNGKCVHGFVPKKDKRFGIEHIKPNLSILDKEIVVASWYDANGEIAAAGDVCIAIGLSPGIIAEVALLKYHYRYKGSKTKLIWFLNTISSKIPPEIAEEIPITYVNNLADLAEILPGKHNVY
jgi:hypothetical protein